MEAIFILFMFLLLPAFWLTPMGMIIWGATNMKKDPPKAKKTIIIAGIWLLVGLGFCGLIMS